MEDIFLVNNDKNDVIIPEGSKITLIIIPLDIHKSNKQKWDDYKKLCLEGVVTLDHTICRIDINDNIIFEGFNNIKLNYIIYIQKYEKLICNLERFMFLSTFDFKFKIAVLNFSLA